MTLLLNKYAVIKLNPYQPIPEWANVNYSNKELLSITYTEEELSIVCPERNIPVTELNLVEKTWNCLKVEGPLDFSLTGILSSLINPLAEEGISIFAISTYNTDYLLIKENKIDQAMQILIKQGHEISK